MIEVLLQNPIWQWLWIIAMLILFYWLTNKDDSKTLKIIMISMLFWIAHFTVMEVYAWVAWSVIWLARVFLSMKYKYNKKIFTWIIIVSILAGILTYKDYYSILPIIGSCISAYWYFFFEKIKLRIFMIVTSLFWFTFSLWNWLIWWIINEIVVQIILLVAMYKMVHEEWRNVYIIDSLLSKFHKPKFDVWRYISIYDFINIKKVWFTDKIKHFFVK